MNTRPWALVAAALTGVQVGAALVASRAVIGELTPGALALLRYSIGVALLWPLWRLSRGAGRRPGPVAGAPTAPPMAVGPAVGPAVGAPTAWPPMAPRERVAIALLGVLQFGVPIVLLNHALHLIPASLAALIFATFPLLTMALAITLGHERWRAPVALGVGLSMAGVAIALGEQVLGTLGSPPSAQAAAGGAASTLAALLLGSGLSLAAALAGASCAVLYRPYLARHAAGRVGVLAMAASVLALLPLALAEGGAAQVMLLSPRGWSAVLFVGVSSGLGYWLWLWALAHAPATRVAVFVALSPITATVLGHGLLDEPWSLALLVGSMAVLGGLALTSFSRSPSATQSHGQQPP